MDKPPPPSRPMSFTLWLNGPEADFVNAEAERTGAKRNTVVRGLINKARKNAERRAKMT